MIPSPAKDRGRDTAVEIAIVAWGSELLIVHIFAAVHVKTKQYGSKWNMGARDEALPPLTPVGGRLARAGQFPRNLPDCGSRSTGRGDCRADE
jgi:hypothetical protein